MSRPWMPLYVADYLADTGHLSTAEHGAYMLLIMHYWQNGGLPTEDRRLARIARMSDAEWADAREVLAAMFDDDWHHKRVDAELAKAADVSSKRKAAADQMHGKRGANAPANAPANAVLLHTLSQSQKEEDLVSEDTSQKEPDTARRDAAGDVLKAEFDQLWRDFPRHRNSRREPAFRAYRHLTQSDRAACLSGAARYSIRFEDDRSDKRPMPERLRFVPHLATWIHQRGWEAEIEALAA